MRAEEVAEAPVPRKCHVANLPVKPGVGRPGHVYPRRAAAVVRQRARARKEAGAVHAGRGEPV